MSRVALLCAVLCASVLVQADSDYDPLQVSREYTEKFQKAFKKANVSVDNAVAATDVQTVGIKFDCDLPELNPPTSIHDLSPRYVDVVAAMGDSVTAGFGAGASTIITDILEFRGLSWSIGGDKNLDKVLTFANLIRKFNPAVTGYSTGIHIPLLTKRVKFNVAVSGAKTGGMLGQAERLVKAMKDKGVTDDQWKVITIWIGGNDVCAIKNNEDAEALATVYVKNIEDTLDYLKANVKRAYVNMVLLIDVADLAIVNGLICNIVHNFACDSILKDETLDEVSKACHSYNSKLDKLMDEGKKYESDDFTVIIQPFFSETEVPRKEDDLPDMSYFAPDCFHFSQKGHAAGATSLWDNMFEAVGEKTDHIDWSTDFNPKCPLSFPYFSTYKNSKDRNGLLTANGGSDEQGTSLVSILVGTGVGVVVVALATIVVAMGIIKLRRRRNQQRGPTEKMRLLYFKTEQVE